MGGLSYALGQGTIKDNFYAYMWSGLAAMNGDENAEKLRYLIAKEMTPLQIEKAQDLAREYVKKNYKGC